MKKNKKELKKAIKNSVKEVKAPKKEAKSPKTAQKAEIKEELNPPEINNNHIIINESTSLKAHWYVVHTYSGHENKVAAMLKQRVESMGLTDNILEILIPTQNKIKISKGAKIDIAEKVFPGYLLVKMVLSDDAWLTVHTTSGITGFVGTGNKPTPLAEKEVEAILKFMAMEAPKYKTSFSTGEAVKIIEGPFANFLGTIDKIDEEKGKISVLVSIFGRETPVELDFLQVSKI
ncbi:transcription termination/antitermination protein NusG [Candidatus Beckwithbacteria bacterium CG10_big_fil_rev_8_21_14_0_10_34_10]|uniref:Transcription termination/antitermination protein NusG n=1 Tax=Candidatus Beckwithbacteria bacterium CG10_big_fil_rev_8_21_14_0_10_34_10 TaxID=1974495 RepID=A0A2H0W888_9BACT|nr:MAG: transcription termination/antitermination protein NusG [Candidatus Beckwithbacteria bacterium CG10_big_fil_rev_8_21_14_0_10_34_10]